MDLYQFEQVYDELGRQEKKQFADYINNQVLNLQEINYQYEKKNIIAFFKHCRFCTFIR